MFKTISLLILNPYLSGILIRNIIVFIIICIIIPELSGKLQVWHTRIEIFILIMILIEILVSRIKSTTTTIPKLLTTIAAKEPKSLLSEDNWKNIVASINQRIKGRNCIFFFKNSGTSLEHIVKKLNYSQCEVLHGKENGIQIFDNLYGLIVSFDLESFKKLSINPESSGAIVNLLKYLKKNKCNNINLLVSINDFIQEEEAQDKLYGTWYLSIQSLSKNLNNKLNINLIIDDVAQIEGFQTLFAKYQNLSEQILGVSFFADLSNNENIVSKFSDKFKILLSNLENILISNTYSSPTDYQLAYMFIQQLNDLKTPISKILECIRVPKVDMPFSQKKESLITVAFINSLSKDPCIVPLVPQWLKHNVEEIKIKNE